VAPRHAHLEGFDLHANHSVRADDRAGVERLCQYLLRPPLAQGRLERLRDGRVLYTLTHAWSDGTRQLLFQPLELGETLAVLVPRPRVNLLCITASWWRMSEDARTPSARPTHRVGRPSAPGLCDRRARLLALQRANVRVSSETGGGCA
jgi:hypothetical protein